jgi:hypothetical protein
MAKVPLPARGQPLDLTYIYQLANAINEVSSELSPTTARYTSIDTVSAGRQSIRTSDARIVGAFEPVRFDSTTNPGGQVEFSYGPFTDFAYAPIVTVTPILLGDVATQSSADINVVLTRVTTSRIEGIVQFNNIGQASIGLNILMVGIPV